MTSTEIALLLNRDTDKIARIGEIISKKIQQRDVFDHLNAFEKTFIYIDIFENHTAKGGFEAFFEDSAGKFAHEILEAYQQINAEQTASLIYDAFQVFGEIPIPKDQESRRKILDKLNANAWLALDQAFYRSEENIMALVLEFVREHTKYFQ